MVEQVDEDYLKRNGLDPEGALYKANLNTLGGGNELGAGANGMDKKTRLQEDKSDMETLINSVGQSGSALDQYLFDNIDLPTVINFMAVSVVIQDIDRWATNFYMYRDSDGTGEWMFLPWDLDLTFGPDRNATNTIVANQDTGNNSSHPLVGGEQFPYSRPTLWNGLLDAVFRNPETLEMFYRRVRSLSDEYLVTNYYADKIDSYNTAMASDVLLDRARWGGSAHFGGTTLSMQAEGNRIKNEYVIPRRTHLLVTHGGASEIPTSQPVAPMVGFGAIEFNPASGEQDEEYIELINGNAFAVDVSGWNLGGGVEYTLRPGTVIPANGSLYLSPDVNRFRARTSSPMGGEGNFVQGGYKGHLSNFGESLILTNTAETLIASTTTPVAPSDPQQYLVISELMYHPAGAGDSEFVELMNISDTVTLDLTGVKLSGGVAFDFTGTIAPGARVLVVRNLAAFEALHGNGHTVAGEFLNGSVLNNDGETIKLDDATNSTILEFTYNDSPPWPVLADGLGQSLVLKLPESRPDPNLAENWRGSAESGGNPGSSDASSFLGNPNADADANGLPDLVDYLLRNSPGGDDVRPSISVGAVETEDYAMFTFRRNRVADDAYETVEVSGNLIDWQPEAVHLSSHDNGDGTSTEIWRSSEPLSATGARWFMRLRATLK